MSQVKQRLLRSAATASGLAVAFAATISMQAATADVIPLDDSDVYLGSRTGFIDPYGNEKFSYKDKQYRSINLPDRRTHYIVVKNPDFCVNKWKVRAAVARSDGGVSTAEQEGKGCDKVGVTVSGKMNAQVTLTVQILIPPPIMSKSKAIKPV